MTRTTPLLLLLDGILSQDEERINQALDQIQSLVVLPKMAESPLDSAFALETIVQVLMMHHPHLAKVGTQLDGSLPLHFAASIGNARVASLLLDRFPEAASTPNSKGKTPLHYAAREGRTEFVVLMTKRKPETAAILSKKGKLALHFAAGEGHAEIVRALLHVHPKGAIIPSKKGKVAIHFAARWGHLQIAKELFQHFPQCIRTLDYEGSLPLHDASREGQLEMARFLIDRYPQGLQVENIRGETPLFPAVRSGNVDLCLHFVKTFPEGGKHVLQRVHVEDNLHEWAPALLDLCLRGATNNFSQLSPSGSTEENDEVETDSGKAFSDEGSRNNVPFNAPFLFSNHTLDINLPRSKSPILEEGEQRKKRNSPDGGNASGNKRSRRESFDGNDCSGILQIANHRPFLQVHAALECGAAAPVLELMLTRHSEQIQMIDDLGKLPLHHAVEHGSNDNIDIIVKQILKPYREACYKRDFLGRLPLHLALMSQADCRLIQVLLDANPSSGVEHCDVVDPRFVDKLPLFMATEHNCDLSTLFLLVRGDPSVVTSWSQESQQDPNR